MIIRLYNYLTNVKGFTPEEARTIICQAAHESDFWRSPVFEHTNNMFGMRTHARKITGKLDNDQNYKGYAAYTNIEGSCNDLADLIRRRNIVASLVDIRVYALALKAKGYYEADVTEYTNGMLHAYKELFPESWAKYNDANA